MGCLLLIVVIVLFPVLPWWAIAILIIAALSSE